MRVKTPQEVYWEGQEGSSWFARNDLNPVTRENLFKAVLSKTFGVRQICELGCGQGHNLLSIGRLSKNYELTGVELNPSAIEILNKNERIRSIQASIQDVEIEHKFDFVFVCGVLVCINEDLPIVYKKMDSLSRRYIFICEYFNPVPVEIVYRGHHGQLFKRDFAKEFMQSANGKYSVVDYGFVWKELDPAWDNVNWTLLEKAEE